MPRSARIVFPNTPHHLTQRGVRRQRVFFGHDDYEAYRKILGSWLERCGVTLWCYCLMPNHTHLEGETDNENGFARALGGAHSAYARRVNRRQNWTGHLWQSRFYSCALDAEHALRTCRYILLNPVRAGLVDDPRDWPYSSIRAHVEGHDDILVAKSPLRDLVNDWKALLGARDDEAEELIRLHTRRRLPLGSDGFIDDLEQKSGRRLRWKRGGRPRKRSTDRPVKVGA